MSIEYDCGAFIDSLLVLVVFIVFVFSINLLYYYKEYQYANHGRDCALDYMNNNKYLNIIDAIGYYFDKCNPFLIVLSQKSLLVKYQILKLLRKKKLMNI